MGKTVLRERDLRNNELRERLGYTALRERLGEKFAEREIVGTMC